MSFDDYLINLLLVAVVIRQLRGRRLTTIGLLWPIGLVVWALIEYMRSIPTSGNDLPLIVGGPVLGILLGASCAFCTAVTRLPDGGIFMRATIAAAVLWVVGVGARLAFGIYAEHGGYPQIVEFGAARALSGIAV
jgi:hypothetical protein